MKSINSYLLQRPGHYLEFRRLVRNIADRGKNERLASIRGALDSLVDEERERASQKANAPRQGPSSALSPDNRKKSRGPRGS